MGRVAQGGLRSPYGFFRGWRRIDFGVQAPGKSAGSFIKYRNTPGIIATLVSSRLATLNELQTVYGPYDAYQMLEIHLVDQHNRGLVNGNGN